MKSLGIDTSNYTTSVSLAEDGKILQNNRRLLKVKQGSLGLRQSEALYQHWENLPELLAPALKEKPDILVVSTKPRPQENSYMPVFNGGHQAAKIISSALQIPMMELSHQEGHILAAAYGNTVDFSKPVVCAHLSGGTLELVSIEDHRIKILGGSLDISYGKLIDRLGVEMGFSFPAGKEMDQLALLGLEKGMEDKKSPFRKVKVNQMSLNLSGIETQLKKAVCDHEKEEIAYYLMKAVSDSFIQLIQNTHIEQVLVSGGVASSQFLRRQCASYGYIFGRPDLCTDNACGLALSEGVRPWA